MKQQYPNAPELLLALVIDSMEEGGCTSSDDIKRRLSELVDNVFEHGAQASPTPAQLTQPNLRVKETIVAQVPKFLDFLHKDYKKRAGNSKSQSPKKKRKVNTGSVDPASFSDEDDEDESMYFEGNSSE
jgi:hypothetical protein